MIGACHGESREIDGWSVKVLLDKHDRVLKGLGTFFLTLRDSGGIIPGINRGITLR